MLEGVLNFLIGWWNFFTEQIYEAIVSLLQEILQALPPNLQPAFGSFLNIFEAANYWLPISDAILVLTALLVFLTLLIIIRWVLKAIPTVW